MKTKKIIDEFGIIQIVPDVEEKVEAKPEPKPKPKPKPKAKPASKSKDKESMMSKAIKSVKGKKG